MHVHNLLLSPTARVQWWGGVGRTGEDRFEGGEGKETVENSGKTTVWWEEGHDRVTGGLLQWALGSQKGEEQFLEA